MKSWRSQSSRRVLTSEEERDVGRDLECKVRKLLKVLMVARKIPTQASSVVEVYCRSPRDVKQLGELTHQPLVIPDPRFSKIGICRKFYKESKKSLSKTFWREET